MATLRQYFETDFDNTIRVHGTLSYNDESLQCLLLYDVSAYSPRLLDVKGLDWKELGEDEVCRQLYKAIDS